MGALDNLMEVEVYDRRTRAQLNIGLDAKLRRMWFENYEKNLPDILATGTLSGRVPTVEQAIVVGAGWSLKKNVHLLASVPEVPVITCDKAAATVAKYVTPLVICALNTDKTSVGAWLTAFYEAMERREADPKDVWLVVPVTVNPEIFEHWKGKIAFTNPQNTCNELTALVEAETGIPPTARGDNVGYYGVITALMLGANTVLMLGMNYCYQTEAEAKKANDFAWVTIKDVRDVYVYTTLDWIDARSEFVTFCEATLEDGIKYVNCSEGGLIYQTDVIDALDFKVWVNFHLYGAGLPKEGGK
jgi:hypothetical protein